MQLNFPLERAVEERENGLARVGVVVDHGTDGAADGQLHVQTVGKSAERWAVAAPSASWV